MRVGRSNLIEVREVNPVTGEVVASGSRFKPFENFVPNKGYLFKAQEHYIRMFASNPLPIDLPMKYAYWMYRLSVHLENETNRLYYAAHRENRAMTVKRIGEYLGISYTTAKRFMKEMMRRHIIARVEISRMETHGPRRVAYYVNPLFFFRGKWISYFLYLLFKEDLDKVLPKWVQYRFAESHRNIDEIRETRYLNGANGKANHIKANTGPALPPPDDSAVHGEGDVEQGGAGCSEGTLSDAVSPGDTDEVYPVHGA